MKCLLIMPPWSPYDVYTGEFSKSVSGVWPPIGHLCSLAATLLQAKNDVEIIDGAFFNHDAILKKVTQSNASFIGFYTNAFLWKSSIKMINMIKSVLPDVHIAVGGPLATAWKEKYFLDCEKIDSIFIGEADYTITHLVDCLRNNTSFESVKGIVYKNKAGQIIENAPAPIIENLDELPFPARHLIENHRYKPPLETYRRLPVTYIFSSRGCTNRCLYCFQISTKQGIRFRSAENVLAEIEECVKKYKIKEIRFFDDNFAYDLDRVDAICEGLIKAKYDLTWYCSSRVDNINLEIMKKLRRSGCWGILFGAESGVQANLNTLRKNATIEQTAQAVGDARKAGLKAVTPFIFGIPGETFQDGLETIEFACKIKPFTVNFHTLTPFPGTELYDNIDKYGKRMGDFIDYTFEKAVFIPHSMGKDEIIKLREIAFKRFFSRPSYIFMRLIKIRTIMDIRILWSGFRAFVKMYRNKRSFSA
ncbi:MAG: radical SAM protein [Chloroflexia bacterium]|nr:radical SAM protein [Chloroflexia bacterium]